MPFNQVNDIRYFYFDLLQLPGLIHGVFTRRGGISPEPWASLNLGGTVGDSQQNVIENRDRIFSVVNRSVDTLYDVWQVHGAKVICADEPRFMDSLPEKADAILADYIGVTLMMRFADCVPILLYDPSNRVVGMVHAGWVGTVKKVVGAAVKGMQERYGASSSDLLVGIGPSIGPDHYNVGEDVVNKVEQAFGDFAPSLLAYRNGKVYFNLWEANRYILEQSGVANVEVAGICTACHLEDWYSHRGEGGKTGRFGAIIALEEL